MATMHVSYKKSLQTMEGKLALAANVIYFTGLAAATVLDLALKQPVFSHYADQLTALSGFMLAFNAYYAKVRSNYKAALSTLVAPLPDGEVSSEG